MNIYLISAESYHIINDEIKKIINDNDYISFNMNTNNINDIFKEANYYSLTNDIKYIIVRNANIFNKDKAKDIDIDNLLNYLEKPNPNTILIFTTLNGIDLRKKIVKIIKEKYQLINILKKDYKSLIETIKSIVITNGYNIDNNTINYIINNSYDSEDIIYNELDKIFMYYNKPCQIEYSDVKKIVGSALDSSNFHFINSIIDKDLKNALKIYKDLQVYKVEPVMLIILLAREYRLLYKVKRLVLKKYNINMLCKELKMLDWQVNKLYNNSFKYTEDELLNHIIFLADMDYKIKSGKWDKTEALYSFIIYACE